LAEKLGRILEELVVVYFKALPEYLHSGTNEKPQNTSWVRLTCGLCRPGYEAGVLATQPRVADALCGGSLQNVRNRLIISLGLKESMITGNIREQ
jgi:hypothetical protein